ncbi:MAG TPA: hypothetical protein VF142_17095 [Longimicrobium sp.]
MRSKLTLNLDDLAVDSFDTTRGEKQKGTVFGEQCTCWTACGQNTCPGCPTCDATCNNTCDDYTCAASCNGTCNNCTGWTCDEYTCACPDTCLKTGCGMAECCA